MPGYDRTGPMGAGPRTGGGWGFCNPANAGYDPRLTNAHDYGRGLAMRRGFRGGFGRGRGRGFGRGYAWYPPAVGTADKPRGVDELEMLRAEAGYMRQSLDAIKRRIEELDEKPAEE